MINVKNIIEDSKEGSVYECSGGMFENNDNVQELMTEEYSESKENEIEE